MHYLKIMHKLNVICTNYCMYIVYMKIVLFKTDVAVKLFYIVEIS